MKTLIVGLGVFGRSLAIQLTQLGAEVVALDRREENVALVKDEVDAAAVIDFADPAPLERFPVDEMDAIVVAIGDDFEASLAFTMKARELGAKRLICRVLSPMHGRLLRLLKVERLVVPEEFAARGLAQSMLMRGALEGIDLGSGHALVEASLPAALEGRTITSLTAHFRQHDVRLVTIKRPDRKLLARLLKPDEGAPVPTRTLGNVPLDEPFQTGDILVLFGSVKNLRSFLDSETGD